MIEGSNESSKIAAWPKPKDILKIEYQCWNFA